MARHADLVLCFDASQRKDIVSLTPSAVRYTFLLNDFANMSRYCAAHHMVSGTTIQERLQSIIEAATYIRPMLPPATDIADPNGKDFEHFQQGTGAVLDAATLLSISSLTAQSPVPRTATNRNQSKVIFDSHRRMMSHPCCVTAPRETSVTLA